MNKHVTQNTHDATFASDVIHADKPVLVDFWADWCGPCGAIAPVLDRLADEYGEKIQIKKLDVDRNPDAVKEYGIRSIPTLILFKEGRPVEMLSGVQSGKSLRAVIDKHTH